MHEQADACAAPPALTGYTHISNWNAADDTVNSALMLIDTHGAGVNPGVRLRAARGTGALPLAVQNGDVLGILLRIGTNY